MRKLHRWVATLAMAFLAWVAVTGVALAIDELTSPPEIDDPVAFAAMQGLRDNPSGTKLPAADAERLAMNALHAALMAAPDANPVAVDLRLRGDDDGRAQARVRLGGNNAPDRTFDAATGAALPPAPPPAPRTEPEKRAAYVALRSRWHDTIERLHRGNIIGLTGQAMDVLTGFAFITLSFTGILMYFDMKRRRKGLGRDAWFWG